MAKKVKSLREPFRGLVLSYGGQVSVGFKSLVWATWRLKLYRDLRHVRFDSVYDRLRQHYCDHGALKLPWDVLPFPKSDKDGRRDVRKAIAWVKKTWKDIEPEVIP